MLASCQQCALKSARHPAFGAGLRHLRSSKHARRQHAPIAVAALEQEALLAVSQQGLLFAAVFVGETYLSRQALREDSPGRPGWIPTIAGAAGVAGAVAAIQGADAQQQLGLALGTAVTAALLIRSGKRFVNTPDDPSDWPGPKIWPATASLLTFFAVCIFGQGLARSLGA